MVGGNTESRTFEALSPRLLEEALLAAVVGDVRARLLDGPKGLDPKPPDLHDRPLIEVLEWGVVDGGTDLRLGQVGSPRAVPVGRHNRSVHR